MLQPAFEDSPVDVVEVVLRHQERVVLRMDVEVAGRLGEVEGDTVGEPDREETTGRHRSGSPNRVVKKYAECCLSFAATMV